MDKLCFTFVCGILCLTWSKYIFSKNENGKSCLLVSLVEEAAPSTPKNPPQNSFGNGMRPGELDPCWVNPTTPSALVIGMVIRIPWGEHVPKVISYINIVCFYQYAIIRFNYVQKHNALLSTQVYLSISIFQDI